MELENMNRDFPNMPESMRQMIEQEIEKQLAKPDVLPGNRKAGRHILKKRLAVAVAAATLALGTTVFAGVLYGLKNNQVGSTLTRQSRSVRTARRTAQCPPQTNSTM